MKKKYIAVALSILLIAMIIAFGKIFLIESVEVNFNRIPSNVSQNEIIAASKIELNTNIFNLKEDEIIENINNFYSDNSVDLLDVERVFPNKVILHIKERNAITAIPYLADNSGQYIPTDKDFQLITPYPEEEIDFDNIIKVSGIIADTTFNKAEFREIKEILGAFAACSFEEEAIAAFIKEIAFSGDTVSVIMRNGDGVLKLKREASFGIYEQTVEVYNKFLELPYQERAVFEIKSSEFLES